VTKTPRTDAEATQSCDSGLRSAFVVHVDFARELEREIERLRRNTGCARNQRSTQFCAEALDAQRDVARLTAERDEAIKQAAQARQTIYRLQHELAGCSRAPADGKHTPAVESFIPEAL
jgi:aspartate/methionine/tyrosine aminotransferase